MDSSTAKSADTPNDEKKAEDNTDDDKKENDPKSNETTNENKADVQDEENTEIKTNESVESEMEQDTTSKSNESIVEENVEKKSDEEEKKETDKHAEDKSIAENVSSQIHDVYTGDVHDPNIKSDERHNYRPINIMFRRKCQNPKIRIQFDRTVIFKNQTFYLNVDGKNVRLVASPQTIETYDDIKTLLQIVNDISLNSCCVESVTQIS